MKRVIWDRQQEVGSWVAARTGGKPFHTDCATAIGQERDGQIVGGCIFEDYRGQSVVMHVAGEGNWFSIDFARAVAGYCFHQLGVKKVIGPVDTTNAAAIKFDEHAGFVREAVLKDAGHQGDLILYTMTKQQCRFLGEKNE